jgi:hypothetical protein
MRGVLFLFRLSVTFSLDNFLYRRNSFFQLALCILDAHIGKRGVEDELSIDPFNAFCEIFRIHVACLEARDEYFAWCFDQDDGCLVWSSLFDFLRSF